MISHDLHAQCICFQACFLPFGAVTAVLHLLHQVLQQSLRSLQALRGVLQQFTQMQQVGQAAFALVLLEQTCGHTLLVQPTVQHGQHALGLPLHQPA